MTNRTVKLVLKLAALAGVGVFVLCGCVIMLDGAGEFGVGYRSETTFFGYHKVDGDKEGIESKSALDVEPVTPPVVGETDETEVETSDTD